LQSWTAALLQPRKWPLIGTQLAEVPRRKLAAAHCPC